MLLRITMVLLWCGLSSLGAWSEGVESRSRVAAPGIQLPQIPAASTNWSGGYVGLHGAYSNWSQADDDVWNAGAQVGYNAHWSSGLVVGVELDGAKSWYRETFDEESSGSIEWTGTLRARVGWATGPVFLYSTAGLGFQALRFRAEDARSDKIATPWVWGGGAELRFSEKSSVKLEYLKFEEELLRPTDNSIEQDLVRLGVNYKF